MRYDRCIRTALGCDGGCSSRSNGSLRRTDPEIYRSVNVAIDMLATSGPGLGRPLVDTLQGSFINNLKELRPRSGRDASIRVLFVFDPWSQAILLTAGNKTGDWSRWYRSAIPVAEVAYEDWLIAEGKRRAESRQSSMTGKTFARSWMMGAARL